MNTPIKTHLVRIAGAAACVVALTGVSMAAAIAAPAPAKPAALGAPTTNNLSEVTNLTPYTWTVFPNGMWGMKTGPYNVAPPTTVQPGQTAVWSAWHAHDSQDDVLTAYTFEDAAGKNHVMQVLDDGDGFDGDNLSSYSMDHVGDQLVDSPDYHMAVDPDGMRRHVDAVWNSPTTIKIDAKADPAAAALAVNVQLPRAAADRTSFVFPQGEQPTVTHSDSTRATSQVINESSEPVTLTQGHDVARGESTSLSEELTWSESAKVFGVAAKTAVSVTSDQEWGTTDAFKTEYDAKIMPNKMGWLNIDTAVSTMTGDLQFTTPEGITYQIANVAIHQPGIAALSGLPTGVNYTPEQGDIPAGK